MGVGSGEMGGWARVGAGVGDGVGSWLAIVAVGDVVPACPSGGIGNAVLQAARASAANAKMAIRR